MFPEKLLSDPVPQKHLHVYERAAHKTRIDLYFCRDPHCNHRINKIYLLGKAAECPFCGQEYVITREMLYKKRKGLKLLHCKNCKKRGKERDQTVELLAQELKKEI